MNFDFACVLGVARCDVTRRMLGAALAKGSRLIPAIKPPKEMTITIIARSSLRDASDALQSALLDDLASHGIKATCIPETAGTPDANLTIEKFDPGSRALRWAIGFGSGEGSDRSQH